MLVPANPPAPTPEFEALTPQPGENPMDALARVGDAISREVGGSDDKDSRKNKKMPRQLATLVLLRAQGFDNQEIATKLGVNKDKLKRLIARARKEYGWNDLGDKVAHVAVPQAVESALKHLEFEGSSLGVMKGQSTMTRAMLAGVGLFKTHSAAKVEQKSESTNVLRVEIAIPQVPPGVQGLQLAEGSVLATPRRALVSDGVPALVASSIVEGEVVNK